jgi:hypothetical protein
MMRQLHEEDLSAFNLDSSRFASSIEYIVSNPSAGQIVLFREAGEGKGNALLVPFWSNEFGGTISLSMSCLWIRALAIAEWAAVSFAILSRSNRSGPSHLVWE